MAKSTTTAAAAKDPAATGEAGAPQSFESALAELEKLVARMEAGNLALDQSLASHKRGLELARYCQDLLSRAEQQVKVLEDDMLRVMPAAAGGDRDED